MAIAVYYKSSQGLAGVFVGLITALATVLGCAGPQPLSIAIDPVDERAYVAALAAAHGDARQGYAAWVCAERDLTPAEFLTDDAQFGHKGNPFDARHDQRAVGRGAVIYKMHCAGCHGVEARGDGPDLTPGRDATNFTSFQKRLNVTLFGGSPKKWFRAVYDGKGDVVETLDGTTTVMPPFDEMLTREQIWLVITYLHSLDKDAEGS